MNYIKVNKENRLEEIKAFPVKCVIAISSRLDVLNQRILSCFETPVLIATNL